MIILKNHFDQKDTAIYGDVISNGCQIFNISELDETCKEHCVPDDIKQDVLKCHQENLGKDDVTADIFDVLIDVEKRNETLIRAVLFATENSSLLDKAMLFFKMNKSIKEAIAQRKILSRKLIEQLSQDQEPEIRSIIACRPDLDKDIIH